jgi:hypothetical protein
MGTRDWGLGNVVSKLIVYQIAKISNKNPLSLVPDP